MANTSSHQTSDIRHQTSNSLIILGASARAAAQSALRAGLRPWCVDLFADRDLRALAPVKRCPHDRYPQAMLEMLDDAPAGAPVLLTGAMENYPDVVRAIAARRPLLGLTGEQMVALRDPWLWKGLKQACPYLDFQCCGVFDSPPGLPVVARPYLVKSRYGGGGRGVRHWQAGERLHREEFLQSFVAGTSVGAVFVGDGEKPTLVGCTLQLVGDQRLGASGFQYCGSIGPVMLEGEIHGRISALGGAVSTHRLRGLFGVDAVIDEGERVWPVEVNPRYTASVEVLERAAQASVISMLMGGLRWQVAGAERGLSREVRPTGKAYVFAKRDGVVGDLYECLSKDEVADVPAVGTAVKEGQPICTVLARGGATDLLAQLHELAERVYTRGVRDA